MREPQPPNLLFYPRTVLLVTPRFYPGFRGVPILMQRKVFRWHPACSLTFEWQPFRVRLALSHEGKQSFRFAGESADRGYSILVFPEGVINDRDTPEMAPF